MIKAISKPDSNGFYKVRYDGYFGKDDFMVDSRVYPYNDGNPVFTYLPEVLKEPLLEEDWTWDEEFSLDDNPPNNKKYDIYYEELQEYYTYLVANHLNFIGYNKIPEIGYFGSEEFKRWYGSNGYAFSRVIATRFYESALRVFDKKAFPKFEIDLRTSAKRLFEGSLIRKADLSGLWNENEDVSSIVYQYTDNYLELEGWGLFDRCYLVEEIDFSGWTMYVQDTYSYGKFVMESPNYLFNCWNWSSAYYNSDGSMRSVRECPPLVGLKKLILKNVKGNISGILHELKELCKIRKLYKQVPSSDKMVTYAPCSITRSRLYNKSTNRYVRDKIKEKYDQFLWDREYIPDYTTLVISPERYKEVVELIKGYEDTIHIEVEGSTIMSEIDTLLSKIKSGGDELNDKIVDFIPEFSDIAVDFVSLKELSPEERKVITKVMTTSVQTMLKIPKNSESFYSIGEVQDILIKKGYPKTLVNESILLYLRDMHLVE